MLSSRVAVFHSARFTLYGENGRPSFSSPDSSNATAPATCGAAMLVPCISCCFDCVNSGTDAMAAPGAHTVTPWPPSMHGSRDVHV